MCVFPTCFKSIFAPWSVYFSFLFYKRGSSIFLENLLRFARESTFRLWANCHLSTDSGNLELAEYPGTYLGCAVIVSTMTSARKLYKGAAGSLS